MACVDTTVLIDLSRGRDTARARAAAAALRQSVGPDEAPVTTRFNVAELSMGVERLGGRERVRHEERVQRLIADLTILEFDAVAARVFARITAHLQEVGRPAGDMDVLIASVAVTNGHALVTRNPIHFADIPELSVVSY